MKLFIFILAIIYTTIFTEAKLKNKYDNDFVFSGEDYGKSTTTKSTTASSNTAQKTWIYDPDNFLCRALTCKAKELCLLENLYTAVCVDKKRLHQSGDIIMSMEKYLSEKENKKAGAESSATLDRMDDQQDDDNEDDDDDDLYGSDDYDIFYDSNSANSDDVPLPSAADSSEISQDGNTRFCVTCPVVKPVFVCGNDNRTYSSLCRLDYHNCIHGSTVKVSCKGFCPCKGKVNSGKFSEITDKRDDSSQEIKPKLIVPEQKQKYKLVSKELKLDNKHYKYLTYNMKEKKFKNQYSTKSPFSIKSTSRSSNELWEDNEIIASTRSPYYPTARKDGCTDVALQAMGDRLVDWFSVIMASNKKKPTSYKAKLGVAMYPTGCKREVGWMFQHLDSDDDSQLSLQELYDLEHDENEHCIRPFLDKCDLNRDIFVSPFEWCRCFMKSERPCEAIKKRIPPESKGMYIPRCDKEGYYKPMQCHSTTGICWCVTKHGVELSNSRTHGKINCDLFLAKSGLDENDGVTQGFHDVQTVKTTTENLSNDISNYMTKDNMDDDDDDDDDQDDEDTIEGSGDKEMDF